MYGRNALSMATEPTKPKKSTRSAKKAPKKTGAPKAPKKTAQKTAKKAVSKKATPKKATPQKKAPKKTASKKTAVKKKTSKKAANKSPQKAAAPIKRQTTGIKRNAVTEEPRVAAKRVVRETATQSAPASVIPPVLASATDDSAYPSAQPLREPPESYGRTCIVLMTRDPWSIYAYWEIASSDAARHQLGQSGGAGPLMLRVHGVPSEQSEIASDGFFDVLVPAEAKGFDISLPETNRSWWVELGYISAKGEFTAICRSEPLRTPSAGPAQAQAPGPFQAEQSTRSEGEQHRLPDVVGGQERRGSEGMQGRLSARPLRPGASEMAPGASPMGRRPEATESFPLDLHTELILHGTTEPDAHVTVGGEPVELRPDGTFTLRMELPDGEQSLPVRVVQATGVSERIVRPVLNKRTEDE